MNSWNEVLTVAGREIVASPGPGWVVLTDHDWDIVESFECDYTEDGEPSMYYNLVGVEDYEGDCTPVLPPASMLTAGDAAWAEAWELLLALPGVRVRDGVINIVVAQQQDGLKDAHIRCCQHEAGIHMRACASTTNPDDISALDNRLRTLQTWLATVAQRAKEQQCG